MVFCFFLKCIPKAVTLARYSTITATSNKFSPMVFRSPLLLDIQFLPDNRPDQARSAACGNRTPNSAKCNPEIICAL